MEQGTGAQKRKPRVLVIRGGAIGDFILTMPAIRLIRENLPDCEIEVLGYPGIIELAVEAGIAEATRSLEHRTMAPLFARDAAIDDVLVAYLCGFNLVVSFLYDPDGFFRASLERIGVKTLIECPFRMEPGKGHASLQLARPLERLAMFLEDTDWKKPFFARPKAGSDRLRLALHPGSGSEKKNWPQEHWLHLGRQIVDTWPEIDLVLLTGEAEAHRGVTEVFQREWRDLPHDHWDSLPLPELADRMAGCDCFLGHDSGTGHLAGACGIPSLLLFGPTDPAIWAPPQAGVKVVQAPAGDLSALLYPDVWSKVAAFLGQK